MAPKFPDSNRRKEIGLFQQIPWRGNIDLASIYFYKCLYGSVVKSVYRSSGGSE